VKSDAPAPEDVRLWAARVLVVLAAAVTVAALLWANSVDSEDENYAYMAGFVIYFVTLPAMTVVALASWVVRRVAIPAAVYLVLAGLVSGIVSVMVREVSEPGSATLVFLVAFDSLVVSGLVVWGMAEVLARSSFAELAPPGPPPEEVAPLPDGHRPPTRVATRRAGFPVEFLLSVGSFVCFMGSFVQGAGQHEVGPPLLWVAVVLALSGATLAGWGFVAARRDPDRAPPWLGRSAIAVGLFVLVVAVPYLP